MLFRSIAVAAGFLAANLFVGAAAAQSRPEAVTVYVSFGENAKNVKRWDGSATLTGGELLSMEARHFTDDDAVTGASSWRAQTRLSQIEGFPKVNYNEMSPAELPPAVYFPLGVYLKIRPTGSARVSVKTEQGDFAFALDDVGLEPLKFIENQVYVSWTPTVEKLTTEDFEDDETAITDLPNGGVAVAWVAYRERGDRVFVRRYENNAWSQPQEASARPGDFFRCSIAVDAEKNLWVFWSERENTRWRIWGRRQVNGSWQQAVEISGDGSNTFHRAAASPDGTVFVVWQSFRPSGRQANSDIYLRAFRNGEWAGPLQVSNSPANDWEPAVATGPNSTAYIAWDTYEKGNYDIRFRAFQNGSLGDVHEVTKSPRFQAHASVAVDGQNRPWLSWDESGANWGKDVGYLITPSMAVPLHQERSLQVAMWDGKTWLTPKKHLEQFYPYRLFPNMENPQIRFDGRGVMTMMFRHWTRRETHGVGSPLGWENFITRFDGETWTHPVAVNNSRSSIEKRPSMTKSSSGEIWAAWMADNRTLENAQPRNAEVYAASVGQSKAPPAYASDRFQPYVEPFTEEIPIHPYEKENVERIREYTLSAGAKKYKIFRGDMHRHTDVSADFKYDGSLIEVYRYALDAAAFDYIVPTDHQLGYDQEFTWWQDEKLTDLFHVPGSFVPLFGYERSVRYPNGHRNVIFAKRGTRTLPIPEAEQRGQIRAEPLYEYLRKNDGISMPHSSGTAQGTDWANYDPEVEPLMEIFQGYRASYEYLGAPLAASPEKLREQRSGFNPIGYYWDALKKGYKIGVQASTDHWSTHISYAMIVAEEHTRDSMFAALKKRHAYGATDNIILDFQAAVDGNNYIMGDEIRSRNVPKLRVRAVGTDTIKQLVIIKNQKFVYVRHPNADEVTIEFTDSELDPGLNYYYVRVLQNDGNVAWSSPIWVE